MALSQRVAAQSETNQARLVIYYRKKTQPSEIHVNNRVIIRRIFKVRPQLRGDDDDIYSPQYMPMGPYHLDISQEIEKEKMRSVRLLQSLSDEDGLRALMEKLEPLARKCYAHGVGDMMSEQFTSMLLNDGCYLLLFFVDYGAVWLPALWASQALAMQLGCVWMPARAFSPAPAMQKRPVGLA
ncbi:hypothetical protein HU200_013630 [Digitaria exilis]|uniref:Uncharacterized protein n=1 Tax=Digitaria exilis TaxID=1010633 RepID=A0A835FDE4_9POAL|nr:hypothetical protein HU200_013630 [Digitaria exilis]